MCGVPPSYGDGTKHEKAAPCTRIPSRVGYTLTPCGGALAHFFHEKIA